jgi:micrococcal nuclease
MRIHRDLGRVLCYAIISLALTFSLASPVLSGADLVTVGRVVDGDTLKIIYQGQEESIRLIGIDTPESKKNKKAYKDAGRSGQDIEQITAMGKRAADFVRDVVRKGDRVSIEFDTQKRDRYSRLLGYVYLENGRMLNEEIIRAGYASPMTIPPNVKYQDRFLKAYREAREARRGLFRG